jgi:hypothetical protein
MVPVQLVSYHAYEEYVPDPPEGDAVRVGAWPLSMVAGGTETVRAGLTVTVAGGVVTVTGVCELSVI